jgi:hypothetical protein
MALVSLDDNALAAVLCCLDNSYSALVTVSKLWNERFKSENLWLEACSMKWGSKYDYNYFNSYAISFHCLSKWILFEGIYTVFEAYPFGIAMKLILTSEHLFEGYVIDDVNLKMLFQITILKNGKFRLCDGVVIDINVDKGVGFVDTEHSFFPSALMRCSASGWTPYTSLIGWQYLQSSAYKLSNPVSSANNTMSKKNVITENNVGQEYIRCPFYRGDLKQKGGIISLGALHVPIATSFDYDSFTDEEGSCYCGGPFESIFRSHCGCKDDKWTMMQAVISRGSTNGFCGLTKDVLNEITLLKCGSITQLDSTVSSDHLATSKLFSSFPVSPQS